MSSVVQREKPGAAAQAGASRVEKLGGALDILALRRAQLGGALLFGVGAPALWLGRGGAASPDGLAAVILAAVVGYVTMRQMRAHPGVRSFGYVLFAFAMSYGVLAVGLWAARAEGVRVLAFASFVLITGWFLLVDALTRRRAVWRLAYVPGTAASGLPRGRAVRWRPLQDPAETVAGASGVVADLSAPHSPPWEQFLARCALEGVPVYDLRQVSEWLTGKVKVQNLSENTLSSGLARMVYVRVKRLGDIAGVLLAAPVILPTVLATALIIRLESPGAALFRQTRMGHRGRPFTIYKLRSMRADAPAGAQFTVDADPRVTRVGAFIRKYRIDELPQAWNILKGEMSWIGPRPEAVALAEWYERETPFYCYRHIVRPGITGWAQVNQGNVSGPELAAEKLQYDFYYIKNLSAWLDLLIVAKTIQTVFTGFGSK